MEFGLYSTDLSLHLEMGDNNDGGENNTATTASLLLNGSNELGATWTPATIFRLSAVSVLMLLTLLGNVAVIITIVSCAELRKQRVNVFMFSLAASDVVVCFVSMPCEILLAMIGQWMLGPVACKLLTYGYMVAMASTTFLLTAMSIDRYQVRFVLICYIFNTHQTANETRQS